MTRFAVLRWNPDTRLATLLEIREAVDVPHLLVAYGKEHGFDANIFARSADPTDKSYYATTVPMAGRP